VPQVDVSVDEASLHGVPEAARARFQRRLGAVAAAYEGERFDDARTLLRPLLSRYGHVPEVQELAGLVDYRLGRWHQAIAHLERFQALTGSVEQLPTVADAHRALGEHERVVELWDELRTSQPGPEAVTEGRIVMAGSLADRGDLAGAIRLLEQGPVRARNAREHHLRLWYALADLYERAGDAGRARRGFDAIVRADPGFVDAAARLADLA
jgi:tetratricopeptide (TPR) repeat protein